MYFNSVIFLNQVGRCPGPQSQTGAQSEDKRGENNVFGRKVGIKTSLIFHVLFQKIILKIVKTSWKFNNFVQYFLQCGNFRRTTVGDQKAQPDSPTER